MTSIAADGNSSWHSYDRFIALRTGEITDADIVQFTDSTYNGVGMSFSVGVARTHEITFSDRIATELIGGITVSTTGSNVNFEEL